MSLGFCHFVSLTQNNRCGASPWGLDNVGPKSRELGLRPLAGRESQVPSGKDTRMFFSTCMFCVFVMDELRKRWAQGKGPCFQVFLKKKKKKRKRKRKLSQIISIKCRPPLQRDTYIFLQSDHLSIAFTVDLVLYLFLCLLTCMKSIHLYHSNAASLGTE